MKPSILVLSVLLTWQISLPAQELEKLLREALFEEEASQDLMQAAEGYEELLETYRSQRQFAATALFRLAEVRRKQDRPKDAAKLYQQLLVEFPTHDPLARLSRENLLAMGESLPTGESALGLDEEGKEIARLRKIVSDSPDLISALDKEGYAPIHRAAKKGNMRVIEFLLENDVDINHETRQDTALSIAARYGHLKTCEYLITAGADLDRGSPLGEAIVSGYQSVGKLLLDEGADLNGVHQMKQHWDLRKPIRDEVMTMLGLSVFRGGHPFVKLLLERGAGVDLVAKGGRTTPLIWAMETNREKIFARLLAQGADVNIGNGQFPTALHYAIGKPKYTDAGHPQVSVRSMVGPKDLSGFARQLVSRTDLAVRDTSGGSALIAAVRAEIFELVPALIESGAELDACDNEEKTALFYSLKAEKWDEAQKLIARGANPDIEVQGAALIEQVPHNMRVHLMRLQYAALNKQQAITLCLPQILYHTPLAAGVGEPPNLASILLEWRNPPSGPQLNNESVTWKQAKIFREAPREIIDVDFTSSSPLPLLEWGDVIEFTTQHWEKASRSGHRVGDLPTRSWYYDQDFKRVLASKRVLKVAVVVDGKTRELTLRGDLRTYDPRFDEAPLVPVSQLAELLGVYKGANIKVERRDHGGFFDFVLGEGGDQIELEDGDTLKVTRDDGASGQCIAFRSPDLLFGSFLPQEGAPPTLLQFLATQYQPVSQHSLSYHQQSLGSNKAWLWDPKALAENEALVNHIQPLSVLPFPDWSTLQVRRGGKQVEVNLKGAIDACQEATTPEEARGWDQPLEWGDVVEVRVKSADVPWTGFTAETRRFFKKALERQVVLQDIQGLFRSVTLQYVASHYHNEFLGAIPVPSEVLENGKVLLTRADSLVEALSGDWGIVDSVYRADTRLTEYPAKTWLVDGDKVIAGSSRPGFRPPSAGSSGGPAAPRGSTTSGARPRVRLPGGLPK